MKPKSPKVKISVRDLCKVFGEDPVSILPLLYDGIDKAELQKKSDHILALNNINIGAHLLFLLILCSIKIERLLFLKFLKILAFFDSYFWPFNKSEDKIKVIFVISAIMPSI